MQARNEELARKVAKVSEDDMAAAQAEFEARCATAERKVRSAAASTKHLLCFMAGQLTQACCCKDGRQLTRHAAHSLPCGLVQVYALTKERDALRRGSEKLNSINELLKEKDNIIAQV